MTNEEILERIEILKKQLEYHDDLCRKAIDRLDIQDARRELSLVEQHMRKIRRLREKMTEDDK